MNKQTEILRKPSTKQQSFLPTWLSNPFGLGTGNTTEQKDGNSTQIQPPPPLPNDRSKVLKGLIRDRPHITVMIGRKGSGKNHLLLKLLLSPYGWKGVYDEITIVSSTFKNQFNKTWSKLDPKGITVHEAMTDELMESFLRSEPSKNSLFIFDDLGEDLTRMTPQNLNKFFSNSRHLNISVVSLHQKIAKQVPTILRANADTIIAFGAVSFIEREALAKEISIIKHAEFNKIMNHATDEEFDFLVATLSHGKLHLYKNFKETLL